MTAEETPGTEAPAEVRRPVLANAAPAKRA